MRSKAMSVTLMMAVLVVSSKGFAAKSAIECEGSGDEMMCMSLPAEAPETALKAQASNAKALVQESSLAMLSAEELGGAEADYTVLAGLDSATADTLGDVDSGSALVSAQVATDRVKSIETFLRSGNSKRNGLVIISGQKN
ncbi:MAG: hypothetical protein V4692_00150 [Bdellovibrionota bacterium]